MALTMIKSRTKLICILTVMFLSLLWNAVNATSLTTLRQRIFHNLSVQSQERVYLSFNNTHYTSGEGVYFSADIVSDPNGSATNLSSVLYVELLAPSGWIVDRQKLKIVDGRANGAFRLAENISSGLYEIRAYTAWMLNYTNVDATEQTIDVSQPNSTISKECWGIFSRVIPIYGNDKSQICIDNSFENSDKEKLDIRFYPEGGHIIKGLPTRVAFEAKDNYGRNVDIKGWLTDGKTKLREVHTTHDGKGVFNVLGEETSDRLTLVLDEEVKKRSFSLPKPLAEGYSLKVDEGKQMDICIARNSHTLGQPLALSVCCRGKMNVFKVLDMQNSMKEILSVCKDSLTTGVNVVTLYNQNGAILAQREVFVNKHDMESNVDVVMQPVEKVDSGYGMMDVAIKLTDKYTGIALGDENFSVSVCEKEKGMRCNYVDVLSYMLLSSEVRGYVNNPQFYFNSNDSLSKKALDVLMMVQGWTRYDYTQLAKPIVSTPKYPIEKGLLIVGRILDAKYNSDIIYSSNYTGDGYTEQQTDLGEGYGESKYWKQWNNPKKKFWLRMDLHANGDFVTAENGISSSDYFSFHMPQFYGKGMAYLMMNRQSMSSSSTNTTGIAGRLLSEKETNGKFLEDTHVLQLNMPIAPWPRRYDFYETNMLQCNNKANISQKKLSPLVDGTPDFSIDINSIMAYISCEKGRVVNFSMHTLQVNRHINLINPNILDFLPKLGINGNIECMVNGKPVSSFNMPEGSIYSKKQMFPADMAFKRIDVYSNSIPSRNLCIDNAKHNEIEMASAGKSPVAILNFVSDSTLYSNSTKFVGNKIEFNGYNEPVEFYSPNNSMSHLSQKEDQQKTFLWIPNLTTDKTGVAHLLVNKGSYNSGDVYIKIEGITKNGKFIHYANSLQSQF